MENETKRKQEDLIRFRFREIREESVDAWRCYVPAGMVKKTKKGTQEEFCEFLGFIAGEKAPTVQSLRNYESGRQPIPTKFLVSIAHRLNIRIEYLLGEDNYRTESEKNIATIGARFETFNERYERLQALGVLLSYEKENDTPFTLADGDHDNKNVFIYEYGKKILTLCCSECDKEKMQSLLADNISENGKLVLLLNLIYDTSQSIIGSFLRLQDSLSFSLPFDSPTGP